MKYTPGRNILTYDDIATTTGSSVTKEETSDGIKLTGTYASASGSPQICYLRTITRGGFPQLAGETVYVGGTFTNNHATDELTIYVNGCTSAPSLTLSPGETKTWNATGVQSGAFYPAVQFRTGGTELNCTYKDVYYSWGKPSEKLAPENTTTMGDSIAADSITI